MLNSIKSIEVLKVITGVLLVALSGLGGVIVSECVYMANNVHSIDDIDKLFSNTKNLFAIATLLFVIAFFITLSCIMVKCFYRMAALSAELKEEGDERHTSHQRLIAQALELGTSIVQIKIKHNQLLAVRAFYIDQEILKRREGNLDDHSLFIMLYELSVTLADIIQQNTDIDKEIVGLVTNITNELGKEQATTKTNEASQA